jgi:hypothetical protein
MSASALCFFEYRPTLLMMPIAGRHQVEAARLVGVLEEGDVLEVVGVDVALGDREVGRVPVGELDQFDLHALCGGFLHRDL